MDMLKKLYPSLSKFFPDKNDKMLNAISQVESGGGKYLNHKPIGDISAYGQFGLMPNTIKEIIKKNKDLAGYNMVEYVPNKDISSYMNQNPELEEAVARKYLDRLQGKFGDNPEKIAYGWLNGVTGTNRAINEGQDIANHWHVKKFKKALGEV